MTSSNLPIVVSRTDRDETSAPGRPARIERPAAPPRASAEERRPGLPKELYRASTARSMAFVLGAAAAFVGFGLLASLVASMSLPLWARLLAVPPLVLLAAHGLHLLGWAGHEGIHLILHPNKYFSTLLGSFAQAMALSSAVGYGVSHWNHHRYTNQASDPDAQVFPKIRTFWSRFLLARTIVNRTYLKNTVAMALGRPLPYGYRLPFSPRAQRALAWANLGFLLLWVGVYAALAVTRPMTALFAVGLPLLLAVPISGLRIYVEHAGTEVGIFRDTRSYTSRLYTWLFVGNNYHLEHHLYPTVPCYNLPAVHRFLASRGYYERWRSPIDATLLGPLVHTTGRSQYPGSPGFDLAHDPFDAPIEPQLVGAFSRSPRRQTAAAGQPLVISASR